MIDAVRRLLEAEPHVRFAILFGSSRGGTVREGGDVDIAIAFDARPSTRALGDLISRLESAAGHPIDLVDLHDAPPAVAFRVFREGVILVNHDRHAFVDRKTRAILEYLDFRPIELLLAEGALKAARGR